MNRAVELERRLTVNLDESQKQAVLSPSPRILVLASAGAGKTRVLTHRLSYLHALYPREVKLAVTFTNRAAEEMKNRTLALLQDCGLLTHGDRLWISTFHSFCARILRIHGHLIGIPPDYLIADEYQQRKIFDEIIREMRREPKEFRDHYHVFQRYRVEFADPPPDLDLFTRTVWTQYLKTMRKNKMLDFADLQHETLKLLESHASVRDYLQTLYFTLLVDEFQDTNEPQYRLFLWLRPEQSSFCVVGDQDQSIFGFRGSRPENFHRLLKDYPDTVTIPLKFNYRTQENIVQAAMRVIAHNPNRIPHEVRALNQGGRLRVHEADSEWDEGQKVGELILELNKERERLDIAILIRARSQLPPIEQGLRKQGVKYHILGLHSWWDSPPIRTVIDYAAFCRDPHIDTFLLSICNIPSRQLGPAAVKRLMEFTRKTGHANLWSALEDAVHNNADIPQGWYRFYKDVQPWLQDARHTPPTSWVASLIHYLKSHWLIPKDRKPSFYERWDDFIDMIRAINSWEELYDHMALHTAEDTSREYETKEKGVKILTVHSAKGLEFDVVLIPGLEEGIYPHFLSQTLEEIQEERRVFFVAMTRARYQVHLFMAKQRRARPRVPSPFFKGISSYEPSRTHRPQQKEWRAGATSQAGNFTMRSDMNSTKSPWVKGQHVEHAYYGKGIIRNVRGQGDTMKIEIWFFTGETRSFRVSHAPLKILDG